MFRLPLLSRPPHQPLRTLSHGRILPLDPREQAVLDQLRARRAARKADRP